MGRRKVVLKVNELQNVDIEYISLVKNAANRSPFKIIKSTEDAVNIDLKNLFSRVRKTESEPAVAAIASVIVQKTVEESALARLKELDMEVLSQTEEDGVVMLNLLEGEHEDLTVIKLDENTAVAITNISKMFAEWPEGNSFVENMRTAGFYPTLHLATDVMKSTIYNAMETVEKGESPAPTVRDILNNFSDYVIKMVEAVPVTAFKFENLTPAEKQAAGDEDTQTGEKPAGDEAVSKGDGTQESEGEEKTTTVQKSDADGDEQPPELTLADVMAQLSSLKESVDASIEKAVSPVKDSLTKSEETTEAALKEIKETVDKHEEALRGTVHNTTSDDTPPPKDREVKKGVFDEVLHFPGLE